MKDDISGTPEVNDEYKMFRSKSLAQLAKEQQLKKLPKLNIRKSSPFDQVSTS
jgi:hypothetical protein